MNKASKYLFVLPVAALLAAGCKVDERYDLEKGVDLDMTLFENGISVPIGSTTSVILDSLLDLNGNEFLTADESGDYVLTFNSPDASSVEIGLPSVSISGFTAGGYTISYNIPSELSGLLGIDYPLEVATEEGSFPVDIENSIPEEVVDIKSIDLTAPISITLSSNVGKCTIKSGFEIDLPSFMTVTCQDPDVTVSDGYKITFKDDIIISGAPKTVSVVVTRIAVPEGSISGGKIAVHSTGIVKGALIVNGKDFTSLPSKLELAIEAEVGATSVQKAEAKLNISETMDGMSYRIGADLSDMKDSGLDFDIILEDPCIHFAVKNDFPIDFEVSGLGLFTKGGEHPLEIDLGNIVLAGGKTTDVYISKKAGRVLKTGDIEIVRPAIGEILRGIPDEIGVNGFTVSVSADEFYEISTENTYEVGASFGLDAPFALSKDSYINYTASFDDLDLDLGELEIKTFELGFDIVNTIPFQLTISPKAFDAEGREVDAGINVDATIKAGTIAKPVTSTVKLNVEADREGILSSISSIKVGIALSVTGESGTLNKNQGITIRDAYLKAGGVSVNVDTEKNDD